MIRTRIALVAAAALASSLFAVPASAQNNPPPGNVNPGSLNSGAEESGAENQPRSIDTYDGPRSSYYGYEALSPYAAPVINVPALGYGASSDPQPRGAPPFGGGYND
jgi:hypothetical protein